MKTSRGLGVSVAFLAVLALVVFSAVPCPSAAEKTAALTQDDCVKCHAGPPADVAAAGAKHRSEVTCLDCHGGHRPAVRNNIPKCGQCHDGKPHYQEKKCLECHKNPHKPLTIAFGGKVTEACLACHTEQIKQLKEHKSRHTSLSCSNCHDVHRKIPECVKCHRPHSAEMAQADCRKCHRAHQPSVVAYGPDVPNKDCGACHRKAVDLMGASPAKHKAVACVKCHASMHRTVPACEQCHPKKHDARLMKKFPKCGTCHYVAHDLNNWPETSAPGKEKAAPRETAPKKGKKR